MDIETVDGIEFVIKKKEEKCYIRTKELFKYLGFNNIPMFIEKFKEELNKYNNLNNEKIEIRLTKDKKNEELEKKYSNFCKCGKITFDAKNVYTAVSYEFLNIILNSENFSEEIKKTIIKLKNKIEKKYFKEEIDIKNKITKQDQVVNKEKLSEKIIEEKQDDISNKQKQANKISNKEQTIEEIIKLYKINGDVSSAICKMSFSYEDFDKKNDNNEYTRNVLSYKGIYKIIIRIYEEDCFGVCKTKEYEYIGSASGGNGIVGRWDEHISKRGDAKKLKNKLENILYSNIKKEIIFMPLIFVKSNISKSAINRLENYYKKEHNTRYSKNNPTGLNQN